MAGALALLIAFGVVVVLQVRKKRAREARENRHELSSDGSRTASRNESNYSVTTHISANNTARNSVQEKPFMTESEKAIVARAVTPDDERNVSIGGTCTNVTGS
jgi:hypothetical protein